MNKHKFQSAGVLLAIILGAGMLLVPIDSAANDFSSLDSVQLDEINMTRGELVTVKVTGLTRVSVADPGIADIADANSDEILLVGQRVGQTALFIWDENGKRTLMIYVYDQDLDLVKNRIKRVLGVADIHEIKMSVNEQEGKVYLTGEVPEDKKKRYDEAIMAFSDSIVDLTESEKIEDLVQIDMQITEMSMSVTKSLGIDWFTGTQTGTGTDLRTTSSSQFTPVYSEIFPNLEPGSDDFFKIGQFQRTSNSALLARINALVQEGKARILSKPKIVVISGEQASFLVGGEVPIRTTTISDSGGSQENVSFKEYGISMTMTPTIKKNEKVDIIMNVEVSDIDAATASTISDDLAFSTRSASTRLYLDDNQTIILAGLIKKQESEIERRIPFISKVPIMGILFRSKANPVPQTDLELVIAMTPHILRQRQPAASAMPTGKEEMMASSAMSLTGAVPILRKKSPYYLGIPKEMTDYVSNGQRQISQAIKYPPEARQYGWEGTVKLGVLILNDGTLAFALVKESSGHDIFDEVALNTTKRLAPFSAFPPDTDLQELNMTIPIVYSLNQR